MPIRNDEEIINIHISKYFLDVISKFGYREINIEMQPMIKYLLNTVLLSMCGAFEQKVETCKYYIASIDLLSRREFLHDVNISEYTSKNIIKIINKFRKVSNKKDNGKDILDIYNTYKESIKSFLDNNFRTCKLIEYLRLDYDIFDRNWLNIHDENIIVNGNTLKINKSEILQNIYDNLFLNRHLLAHNLMSLYTDEVFHGREELVYYENNYFIKISLLMCFDLYLIDVMKKIIEMC